jgi:hypothetical protein
MKHDDRHAADDYLWDRSGAVDPEVARLEALLGTLRYTPGANAGPLALPKRPRVRRFLMPAMAAAILCVVAGGAAWLALGSTSGWWVQSLAGTPLVDGSALNKTGRLRTGEWLITDAAAAARLAIGRIGQVVVEPNSRVQLVSARGREHRIALERGTIHARIWAPPKFFFVNTPSAVAIDLGCAYTLTVDDEGTGLLRVTQGWVSLEHEGRESFIPQGAMCLTKPGVGPGTPHYDDAPSGYPAALATLDFGDVDAPTRANAFATVVFNARRRDALTLWHLLSRGTPGERARVYDALSALAPPPPGVTRDACLRGDRRALDQWWDALGIDNGTWWKLWKKKAF